MGETDVSSADLFVTINEGIHPNKTLTVASGGVWSRVARPCGVRIVWCNSYRDNDETDNFLEETTGGNLFH